MILGSDDLNEKLPMHQAWYGGRKWNSKKVKITSTHKSLVHQSYCKQLILQNKSPQTEIKETKESVYYVHHIAVKN